ncbi:hypothetical protein F8M41_012347 [Gigaspora margarita]|uniref:Uncharacterized protein n=1 Tax=Gigaspora margarita TaxID=4874 RepID=A0A8H4AT75_GIGMA|nr:hypothetical protein F8M41_012347 [Gigaspora margarita]
MNPISLKLQKKSQIKTFTTTELFSNLFTPTYQQGNYTKIKKAKLAKNSFDSYRISLLFYYRSINDNLSQSLLLSPNENHIIILHYGNYSASEIEILYMLKNQKKHNIKYKTIKVIEVSSTKGLSTKNEPFDKHSQTKIINAKLNKNPFDSKYNKTNYKNSLLCYCQSINDTELFFNLFFLAPTLYERSYHIINIKFQNQNLPILEEQ